MSATTRLLMTTDGVGGVWQYALDLATALAPLGVETILAVLGPAPDAAQRADADAAGIRLIDTALPLDWLSDGPAPVVAAGEAIAALATAEQVDLVQLNMPTLGARATFAVPVIAVTHGCITTWWSAAHGDTLPAAYRWQRSMTHEALSAADIVVAPSRSHAAEISRHYRLAAAPVAIHNGRRRIAAGDGTRAQTVFTAGRLWDRVKDTATLDAVAAGLDVPFRAAGATVGPHGETVRPAHLHLLGQLDTAALGAELAQRPVFVSAACFEPFGLAVLEAAASGCPLVLSDIATFRELWDGAALFVPVGDVEGYRVAIDRILTDAALAAQLSDAAALRAARYTPEATAAAMAALYAQRLDTRRAAA